MAGPPTKVLWLSHRRIVFIVIGLCVCIGLLAVPPINRLFHPIKLLLLGRATIQERLEQYGPAARDQLRPMFERVQVAYPPARLTLVGLKQEKVLEIYAGGSASTMRRVTSIPVLAASGGAGPKLVRGDRQVPEGLYRVEGLNPNSRFHLSIKVDYPNAFDKQMAATDGRTDLGGDIFIHGGAASVGCLAIGDEAIEVLFVLLADTGVENVDIVLAPLDLRTNTLPETLAEDNWRRSLYLDVRAALDVLPTDTKNVIANDGTETGTETGSLPVLVSPPAD
jgi:hypothetical protein